MIDYENAADSHHYFPHTGLMGEKTDKWKTKAPFILNIIVTLADLASPILQILFLVIDYQRRGKKKKEDI